MTDTHFDIAIIGAGPGGYVAALKAALLDEDDCAWTRSV